MLILEKSVTANFDYVRHFIQSYNVLWSPSLHTTKAAALTLAINTSFWLKLAGLPFCGFGKKACGVCVVNTCDGTLIEFFVMYRRIMGSLYLECSLTGTVKRETHWCLQPLEATE